MENYEKIDNELKKAAKKAKDSQNEFVKVCIRIPKKFLIDLKRNKLNAEEKNCFLSVQDQIITALKEYLKKTSK